MYDTRHRIRNAASQGSRVAAKVTDSVGETVDPADNPESLDKDRPLREDIRLLGAFARRHFARARGRRGV